MGPADLAAVEAGLKLVYVAEVRVRPAIPLPSQAYYKPRARYRADVLLKTLGATAGAGEKVIGVTSADISTSKGAYKDWGVFGLGEQPGSACVVSKFRLRRQGESKALERLARVAIHEVGHTLGLAHCPSPGCIMADAKGAVASVDAGAGFCQECRGKVATLLPNEPR